MPFASDVIAVALVAASMAAAVVLVAALVALLAVAAAVAVVVAANVKAEADVMAAGMVAAGMVAAGMVAAGSCVASIGQTRVSISCLRLLPRRRCLGDGIKDTVQARTIYCSDRESLLQGWTLDEPPLVL